jgi:hypothetical protein
MSELLWAAVGLLAVALTVLSLRSAWREERGADAPEARPPRSRRPTSRRPKSRRPKAQAAEGTARGQSA